MSNSLWIKNSAAECFEKLKEVFVDNPKSREHVFEWQKRYSAGRKEVEDDKHFSRSVTVRMQGKVKKINKSMWKDRILSARMITYKVNTNKKIRQI